jgi:hypothetical protein
MVLTPVIPQPERNIPQLSQTQKLLKLLLMQTANSFPMLLKNNGSIKGGENAPFFL